MERGLVSYSIRNNFLLSILTISPGNLTEDLKRNWTPSHWVCQIVQLLAECGKVALSPWGPRSKTIAEILWNTIWHRSWVCEMRLVYPDNVCRDEFEHNKFKIVELPRYEFPSRKADGELQISIALRISKFVAPKYLPLQQEPVASGVQQQPREVPRQAGVAQPRKTTG